MFGVHGSVVMWITLRATMGRKRALLFAITPLILLLVTVAIKLAHPAHTAWQGHVLGIFGFTVVLPLTALIIGTSVLGAEVDEGSIVHLLATPVPRSGLGCVCHRLGPRARLVPHRALCVARDRHGDPCRLAKRWARRRHYRE